MARRIYDCAGPPIARATTQRALLADIAYVALKPVEWIAFGLLVISAPQVRQMADRIYPSECD